MTRFDLFILFVCAALMLSATAESTITVSPHSLVADQPTVVEFTISPDNGGIGVGGGARFNVYLKWSELTKGVSDDRSTNTWVTATRSDGGPVEIVNVNNSEEWVSLSDLDVLVKETPLAQGESIAVQFGTKEHPVKFTRKQEVMYIEVALDTDGDKKFELSLPAEVSVTAGAPASLHLVATSTAGVNEPVRLVGWVEDGRRNVCDMYEAALALSCEASDAQLPPSLEIKPRPADADLFRNETTVRFAKPGVYFVNAKDVDHGVSTVSNAIIITEEPPTKRVYWGDLHVHTQLSDGKGELIDVYREAYARGQDYIAITDHSFGRDARGSLEERIADICKQVNRFNRPGDFVTIPAGETHYIPSHTNMYFVEPDADKILAFLGDIQANQYSHAVKSGDNEAALTAASDRYWATYDEPEHNGLLMAWPHHTMWNGRREFASANHLRLFEVASGVGLSEMRDQTGIAERIKMTRTNGGPETRYSARELLNDGFHIGFVAASDTHTGQAGIEQLTGILSESLTRDAIMKALYERQCYGSGRNRVYIDFTINGAPGGQFVSPASAYVVKGFVAVQDPIQQVEIFGNGQVQHTETPDEDNNVVRFAWTPATLEPGYYYLRVVRKNQQLAWSSPVWIE